MEESSSDWIIEESKGADFGDKRLNKRYEDLLGNFSQTPSKNIPATFKSWKETIAAYRFLNHKNVTDLQILSPHKTATLERIKKEKIVLIAQDTTEIDFTGRKSLSGIGYLTQASGQGFYLHPSIAFTPERNCLGVVDVQTWTRESLGEREKRKHKPIEEKETYCWLKGYEAANKIALAASDTVVVSLSDREGDIYEVLEKTPSEENKAYGLIRCQHNRSVLNENNGKFELTLRETVNASEPMGKIEFNMPAGISYRKNCEKRQIRTKRLVQQEVRVGNIFLRPPQRYNKKLEPVSIYVVHCKEIKPPPGEAPIEWFLLTSFPVKNLQIATQVIEWYLCRWMIETFFKVLKSGCLVEKLQFKTLSGTLNCIAFYMIVAWRVLYLTMLGRCCPDIDCSTVFETSEWQSVYAIVHKKPPPAVAPKLNEMIMMIAQLGGFLSRKSDGYPGSKVIWIGIQRMRDFTLAWETFRFRRGK